MTWRLHRLIVSALGMPAGLVFSPGMEDRLKPRDPEPFTPRTELNEHMGTPPSDVARIELSAEPTVAEARRISFFNLGAAVKALVSLPLLLLGRLLLFLLGRVLKLALGPVWGFLAELLLWAGLLFILFALVWKLLFPNRPLWNAFKNKRWLWMLGAALALTGIRRILRLWRNHRVLSELLLAAAAFMLLWLLYKRLFKNVPPPEQTKKWIELPRF